MLEVLLLHLIIPGRINFLQLGRYGRFGEQRYRQQFGRRFDWLSFNANLAGSQIGNRVAIALIRAISANRVNVLPTLGVFGRVVPGWLNVVWKSPALVSLIWTFIPASIWRLFKHHRQKHWSKSNTH